MDALKPYYYGDGRRNVVFLTELQAWTVNNLQSFPVEGQTFTGFEVEFPPSQFGTRELIEVYNEAADILTEYCKTNTVRYDKIDLDILRPVGMLHHLYLKMRRW